MPHITADMASHQNEKQHIKYTWELYLAEEERHQSRGFCEMLSSVQVSLWLGFSILHWIQAVCYVTTDYSPISEYKILAVGYVTIHYFPKSEYKILTSIVSYTSFTSYSNEFTVHPHRYLCFHITQNTNFEVIPKTLEENNPIRGSVNEQNVKQSNNISVSLNRTAIHIYNL